ncbi:imelysin family protein [Psychroserpens burtonensis]|uniref:Imelysin family protein n=1 Tax=Psychroserpens burtonensis TaxID=49278 RepID=A0A5C7BA30_9FLAO|nr:imelysin family protein [Psychroserpens burtonensis]TXE16901.1 imelysin family protein [Psychroserpens burtonensis]
MMKKIVLSLFTIVLFVACTESDDTGGSGGTSDDFNRQAMLTNWADNIIIPAVQDLSSDLGTLSANKDAFLASPNQTTLDAIRVSWLEAYKTWQYVEMFNIGKAEEFNYAFQMNIYPTNVRDIQSNISSGTYDLASVNNNDAVGFPAVDYMLYGLSNSDTEILDAYTIVSNFEAHKSYLSDLINQMQALTTTVLSDWTSNYRDIFVNSSANTATSSSNKLTNDFIFYYEKGLRANKFGIPAGVFSTTSFNDKVEAFYNKDASKILALEALQAVQDFFNGKAYNASISGESFNSYLQYLNTIKEGDDLSALINNQFNTAESKIQVLSNDFSLQVETDNNKMLEAFDELQKAVVLLKVDMIQAMNISVDFVDADGD